MRLLTVSLYFFLTVIIFASIGVWLPYVFENVRNVPHSMTDLNQNVVTYFIAIYGCAILDYFIKLLDTNGPYRKPVMLFIGIVTILVLAMTAFELYENTKGLASKLSVFCILGVIFSYLAWWLTNYNNPSFDSENSLGGKPDKPLKDG